MRAAAGTASFLLLFGAGCAFVATRPKMEMSLAATAFLAARKANAQTLAAGDYRRAEFYFLKAKALYKKKHFDRAKRYAVLSKEHSEKAEYKAMSRALEERY